MRHRRSRVFFFCGSTFLQQFGELRSSVLGFFAPRRANHNAGRMQVVVQRLALAQELRREDYSPVGQARGKLFGVANGNGGFYYDPSSFIYRARSGNGRFDARSVKEVLLRVVVCGSGDDGKVSAFVGFALIECSREIQLALAFGPLAQEALDLRIGNGAFAVVQQGHLFRHHIQSAHFIVLRQQHGQRKAHISHSRYGYLH